LADAPQSSSTVYELRVYHTYEGKLDDLLRRFRDHTMQLFEKHGIKNVAYWTPTDDPLKGKTLVYIISAAKPPPPTGKPSRTTPNGNPSATNPKPTAKSSKKSTPPS
jgi:hypothetical protein